MLFRDSINFVFNRPDKLYNSLTMNELNVLKKNVTNVWGQQGKIWLEQLPAIIESLAKHWSLSKITPVKNMSYNYVALANQNLKDPVVLKISCDTQLVTDEYNALKHFNGNGAIKVIDFNKPFNALLLQQAIPGDLLKNHHTKNTAETISIYAGVVSSLTKLNQPNTSPTHVSKWCKAIDRITDQRVDKRFIKKAKELRDFLLPSIQKEYLCHGDLHLENIINHESQWLCIDPKGIVGEVAFEAAAFDLIDKREWTEPETIESKIIQRINLLAETLEINQNRLLAWIFLRVIISAQWFIEDNGNPDEMLQLASKLFPLIDCSTLITI